MTFDGNSIVGQSAKLQLSATDGKIISTLLKASKSLKEI
jgi:hypothetical protein